MWATVKTRRFAQQAVDVEWDDGSSSTHLPLGERVVDRELLGNRVWVDYDNHQLTVLDTQETRQRDLLAAPEKLPQWTPLPTSTETSLTAEQLRRATALKIARDVLKEVNFVKQSVPGGPYMLIDVARYVIDGSKPDLGDDS